MSLLTEGQIADILEILNVCGTTTRARDLEQWNEKQQPAQPLAQFEPDWSKAPNNATLAALDLSWWITEHGNWSNSKRIATYERPEPVITPHPHAELMMQYAEIAARRVDPWVEFECKTPNDAYFKKAEYPIAFRDNCQYRHIGETK